jgi:hypothetical protein
MSYSSSIDYLLDAYWSNRPMPKQYESIPSPSRAINEFENASVEDDDLYLDLLLSEE